MNQALDAGSALTNEPIFVISESNIVENDATYVCDNCGEEIVIPIDLAAGSTQEYVEDCPVCCSPSVINVEIMDGDVRVWATPE